MAHHADIGAEDIATTFHAEHERIFMVRDPDSAVEIIGWRAVVTCALQAGAEAPSRHAPAHDDAPRTRPVRFQAAPMQDVPVLREQSLQPGQWRAGPAIVESEFTTVVIDPGTRFARLASGSLVIALEERA